MVGRRGTRQAIGLKPNLKNVEAKPVHEELVCEISIEG